MSDPIRIKVHTGDEILDYISPPMPSEEENEIFDELVALEFFDEEDREEFLKGFFMGRNDKEED